MVVILLPAAAPSGVEQDRAGCPFTCTVQAPHSAMPQPYLVPVMPRWSRRTHRRGVSRSASTDMGLPLTFRAIIEELLEKNPPQLFSALPADLCRGQVISGGNPAIETFRRADASRSRARKRVRSRASPRLVVRRCRHGGVGGQRRRGGRRRRDRGYDGRHGAARGRRRNGALRRAAGGLSHLYRTLGGGLRKAIGRGDERRENERDKDPQSFHLSSFFLGFEDPDSRIIG